MFCVRCGSANAEGSRFCSKCGAPMGASAPGVPPPVQPPAPSMAPPAASNQAAAQAYIPPPETLGPMETSGKAVGSLISGILFFFFPAAIVAIVLGHMALSEIGRSAGRLTGRGMAIAGLVLGYAGVAFIPFVLIIAAIAVPNLLRARMAANEAGAVINLRKIASADVQYMAAYGNGYAPSLDALAGSAGDTKPGCDHAMLIDSDVAFGQSHGYFFSYAPAPAENHRPLVLSPEAAANGCTNAGSPDGFSANADPVQRGATGQRSFYVDQTGVVRFDSAGNASPSSDPLP